MNNYRFYKLQSAIFIAASFVAEKGTYAAYATLGLGLIYLVGSWFSSDNSCKCDETIKD